MKKVLVALATLGYAAPALAGNYCSPQGGCTGPSANDYHRYQQRTDPGYNGAIYRNGQYYYPRGYYGGTLLGDAVACLFFCSRHRNRAGDVCYDANGQMFALDRNKRWYAVPGSAPVNMDSRSYATMKCGWNAAQYGG